MRPILLGRISPLPVSASLFLVACSSGAQHLAPHDPERPFGSQSPFVRRPSLDDARRITPLALRATRTLQQAALRCRVAAGGALESCVVDLESQPDVGLGKAALEAAELTSLRETLATGAPSEGNFVSITIVFDLGGAPDRSDYGGVYPGLFGLFPSMPSPARWVTAPKDIEHPAAR